MSIVSRVWSRDASPLGYEQITDLSLATKLHVPGEARTACLIAEDADVRWRDDGHDPTPSIGMPLKAGESLIYEGQLACFRVIQVKAKAKINVAYWG